jgi:hypothetical protein
MISKKTFNKIKKKLNIKRELPYNSENVRELLYKYYQYEKEFGEAEFKTPSGSREIY